MTTVAQPSATTRTRQYAVQFSTDDRWLAVERLGAALLDALGYDVAHDPSIRDTPRRWAQFWRAFIEHDPGVCDTTFPVDGIESDQMVAVRNVKVWSLCEHHLLPFWCDVTMAYIPTGRILGLSKFARIARHAASRLQVQERLTREIADAIQQITGSPNVAVFATGVHTCMAMRGVRSEGIMENSVIRGAFRRDSAARAEFFALANRP